MNLLVTLDEHYYPQLQVMLSSLRINNPGEKFSLYLFHSGLTEQILEQIDKWCKSADYIFSRPGWMGRHSGELQTMTAIPVYQRASGRAGSSRSGRLKCPVWR